ncbi:MAG TPA: conjugative transfer system coupling protein TraD [Ramlibacter sp.]|jgi:conjugal transfer pilus assembly protein TraD|nr:conjugative transfer system coupling protein TraD [Ramlibacter sp.]
MAERNRFEQLLRPAYEGRAALVWALACLWMLGITAMFRAPRASLLTCAAVALGMALLRAHTARRLLRYKLSLTGQPAATLSVTRMQHAMEQLGPQLWLGWGYRWEPRHTQRAYEIMKRDLNEVYPPLWWLRVAGRRLDPRQAKGLPWIHGLDMGERDVTLPFDALKGHCAIIATTGAIKTRLAALVIFQLATRGDCVIVIDPKGDKDLRETCRQAAIASGDPKRFLMLHPAFASSSVRLDLVKNWDRVSQVASRITMVLDTQESDTFKEFCWMAVHRITNAMKYIGQRVSIHTLKTAMESRTTVEHLTQQALHKFFHEECPQLAGTLERQANAIAATATSRPQRSGIEVATSELAAMVKVFQEDIPEHAEQARRQGLPVKPEELRGLIAILEANREWFGKMIVSITPMLTKLTTDDLRSLLSPDYEDIDDARPIMDMRRIVAGGHILYIGTDTLADHSVGRAISTMALADASAVAAEIYNHGVPSDSGHEPRRVHVVIDEWGDAVCDPVIQQANKGRGAGFFIWALGQTFSDLVDQFGGNTARAKRFIGNMNNLIVGATHDPDTIELVMDKLGVTTVPVRGQAVGVGSKTEDLGLEFSANASTSMSEKDRELFPRSLLPSLPDLHYIGFFNRGELVKGRIPVLVADRERSP